MVFFLIMVLSCQSKKENQENVSIATPPINKEAARPEPIEIEDFLGTWRFKDPHPSEQLVEDHYMVIEMSDSVLTGRYYGTTDDFDDSREGYFPGFFFSKMEDLKIENDTIKFKLKVSNDRLYKEPVPLKFKVGDNIDLSQWEYVVTYFERDYVGLFTDKGIEFDIYLREERVFKKQ